MSGLFVLLSCPAPSAADTRATGLGGSQVSSGFGVSGADANPALLLAPRSTADPWHFRWRLDGATYMDTNLIDLLDDSTDLLDDIEAEIDQLSSRTLTCNPLTDTRESRCLDNTATLGQLFGDAGNLLEKVDGQNAELQAEMRLGLAATGLGMPIAVDLGYRTTAHALPDVSRADFEYIQKLTDMLIDGELTLGEIQDSADITLSGSGDSVNIDLPEDTLSSSAGLALIRRTELALSTATTLTLGQQPLDIGATVRIAQVTAGHITENITDFDSDKDYVELLSDNEVSDTLVNLDLGIATRLASNPDVTLAAALRRLVGEEIDVAGYRFESTPQALVSAAWLRDSLLLTGDIALNSAMLDNIESRSITFGLEKHLGPLKLRGGLAHDLARDDNATSLSFGLGIGAVDFALSGNSAQIRTGLQVAIRF